MEELAKPRYASGSRNRQSSAFEGEIDLVIIDIDYND